MNSERRGTRRARKEPVIPIAISRSSGLEFELSQGIVQRRANCNAVALDVRIKDSRRGVIGALSFGTVLQPAKPVQPASVRRPKLPGKASPIIVIPVHLNGQAQLAHVADTLRPLC